MKFRHISISFALSIAAFASSSAGIRIDFDRDNSTYNWLTSINYNYAHNQSVFGTYFDGQSNLIKTGYKRWQENAGAGFKSNIFLWPGLGLIVNGDYTVNGLDKRRVKTSELAAGLSIRPTAYLELSPTVLGSIKKRSELEAQLDEKGIGYGFDGLLSRTNIKNITVTGNISYDKVNLSNIPWQQGEGSFSARTNYGKIDSVSLMFRGLEATKRFYDTSGKTESITRQIKQEREAVVAMYVKFPAGLQLIVDGGAHLSRYLYRQSRSEVTSATLKDNFGRGENYQVAIAGTPWSFARLSVEYLWSTTGEDFVGRELDLDTDKGEISFHGAVSLSSRDSVTADMVFGVTSYSNPNPNSSLEDRDQKTILINGGYNHIFSDYFRVGASAGANIFHQVYISGARSANNGRNDTYIFSPYCIWTLRDNLSIKQSYDIQANYITFDFDRKKLATKNRIFRRASSRTEVDYEISERLRISQSYIYRYEDYGLLVWDDGWQQSVSWDRRRNGLETELVYKPAAVIRLTPRFSWEKTGDYNRAIDPQSDVENPLEIRYLKDEQVKMYFEFECAFFWSADRRLTADFSHRLRKFMNRPRENNDYIRISMEYLF